MAGGSAAHKLVPPWSSVSGLSPPSRQQEPSTRRLFRLFIPRLSEPAHTSQAIPQSHWIIHAFLNRRWAWRQWGVRTQTLCLQLELPWWLRW